MPGWERADLPLWARVAAFERELAAARVEQRAQEEFVRGRAYGFREARGHAAGWQSGFWEGFEAGWHAALEDARWRVMPPQRSWLDEIRVARRRGPAGADWLARFGLEGRSGEREEREGQGGLAG